MHWQQSIETQSQFLELIRQDSSDMQLDYTAVRQQSTFSPGKSETELEQFSSSVSIPNSLPNPSILPEGRADTVVTSESNSSSFHHSAGGLETSSETFSSRTELTSGPVVRSSRFDSLNIESAFEFGGSVIQSSVVSESTQWNSTATSRQTLTAIPSPLVPNGAIEISTSSSSFESETHLPGFSTRQTSESFVAETEMPGMTQSLEEWSYEVDLGDTELSVVQSRSEVSMPGSGIPSIGLNSRGISIATESTSLSWDTPFGETTFSLNEVVMSSNRGVPTNTFSTQSTWLQSEIGTMSLSNTVSQQSLGPVTQQSISVNRIDHNMSLAPNLQLESSSTIELSNESRMSICEFDHSQTRLSSMDLRMAVNPEVSFDITQQTNTVSLGLGVN